MAARTLLVLSARTDAAAHEAVAAGRWPRKDFLELARALDADVLDLDTLDRNGIRRTVARLTGVAVAQGALAFARRGSYDSIFCDGEHIGLPLAALLARTRNRPRHVSLGHLLSTHGKQMFAQVLRPAGGLDLMLLHATTQRVAAAQIGLRSEQTRLIPYGVDMRFWSPRAAATAEPLICSAGLEYRDYTTLAAAVAGLPLRAVLAAGSRWSRHGGPGGPPLPANVEVTRLDYAALRDLYAAARFVVVPLHDVENQAGVTTILEAMAMGKAVIVSATRGQRDVVRGRMWTAAGASATLLGDPRVFGAGDGGECGIYVPPGDAAALSAAIRHLLDHPNEAARLGAAGRALAARSFSLDRYVAEIAAAVRGLPSPGRWPSPPAPSPQQETAQRPPAAGRRGDSHTLTGGQMRLTLE
jgi:glycosyltransferase involved in cell wall biosynthesis